VANAVEVLETDPACLGGHEAGKDSMAFVFCSPRKGSNAWGIGKEIPVRDRIFRSFSVIEIPKPRTRRG
jgi:hypothetical protein